MYNGTRVGGWVGVVTMTTNRKCKDALFVYSKYMYKCVLGISAIVLRDWQTTYIATYVCRTHY